MKIKEIHAKAGPPAGYLLYFLPVFTWYFLENIYTSMHVDVQASTIAILMFWGFRLVLVPLILAGVFGGIHERQQTAELSSAGAFLKGVIKYYWRILAANLVVILLYLLVAIVALVIAGPEETDAIDLWITLMVSPISAISLFWMVAIVVERKLFPSLPRGVKTLLFNPYALLVGIAWAAIAAADNLLYEAGVNQTYLAVDALRAGVLAAGRIFAVVYALAIYKLSRVTEDASKSSSSQDTASTTEEDGLVNVGFGFGLIAFIPLVHLLALIFGMIALRRKKRFVLRSAIACFAGGFFTIVYSLVIAGWVLTAASPSKAPTYAFLSEANPGIGQQVALLEQGSIDEVQLQLEQDLSTSQDRHWTLDCLSALAKYSDYDQDLDGALEDFRTAAGKEPERSEFYFYYGVALLDGGKPETAARQFQAALSHEPRLDIAQQYINLIEATYEPSTLISTLLFVIVLLILFTLHEYGHAYAAWKLGDDTAKNLGRLTLNPIPHLDLFGSIILPGIMLWQQTGFVFGWAKPVPVNVENFKNPQKDNVRVAFAGPAVNLIISAVCLVTLGFLMLFVRIAWPATLTLNLAAPYSPVSMIGPPIAQWLVYIVIFLKQMFYTSLILGCFNLIPVPPLDGSWILSGLLPQKLSGLFEKTRRFGFLIFLLLVVTSVLDSVMAIPISLAWTALAILFSAMGLG